MRFALVMEEYLIGGSDQIRRRGRENVYLLEWQVRLEERTLSNDPEFIKSNSSVLNVDFTFSNMRKGKPMKRSKLPLSPLLSSLASVTRSVSLSVSRLGSPESCSDRNRPVLSLSPVLCLGLAGFLTRNKGYQRILECA